MDCELCKNFEKHPFVREIRDDYCNGYNKWVKELTNDEILLCKYFEEE